MIYMIAVDNEFSNKTIESAAESLVKKMALDTHLKTGKRVELVEVAYTGKNSVKVLRRVKVYEKQSKCECCGKPSSKTEGLDLCQLCYDGGGAYNACQDGECGDECTLCKLGRECFCEEV